VTHDLTLADLANFTGTELWHRHPIVRNVLFTDGALYVADHGGAHWLLDSIAINQMRPEIAAEEFQLWKLQVTNNVGTLTCDDGNGNIVYSEHITYTDFPLPEVELWFTNDVICLPSEN